MSRPPTPKGFIVISDLRRMLGGIGATTLYRWINQHHFPSPTRLDPWHVAWDQNKVEEWIAGYISPWSHVSGGPYRLKPMHSRPTPFVRVAPTSQAS